jgi:hypothetical protein
MRGTMRSLLTTACLGMALASVGCQTYQVGQTLPSPGIMRDDLQYFPKGPDFPLSNELNALQAAEIDRATNTAR